MEVRAGQTIRMTTVATPAEGVTLDQLVEILRFRGVEIVTVDRAKGWVVVARDEVRT